MDPCASVGGADLAASTGKRCWCAQALQFSFSSICIMVEVCTVPECSHAWWGSCDQVDPATEVVLVEAAL